MLPQAVKSAVTPAKRAGNKRRRLKMSSSDFDAVYAIGDVHGRIDLLEEAEEKIADLTARKGRGLVVLLGDYVDRGPNSKAVLERLTSPPNGNFERVCLCGNHDDVMAKFCASPLQNLNWLQFGGGETLRSYGIDISQYKLDAANEPELVEQLTASIPQKHLDFLADAPVALEMGKLLFVHAGIAPGIALEDQRDRDLMWIRQPFIADGPKLDINVVHGHTPFDEVDIGPNRVGIDTGAYATGKLSVIYFRNGQLRKLK